MNENDVLRLIESDPDMMDVIRAVSSLDLPDWAIAAGFIRNKVWDTLHGYERATPPGDIDVAYFDPEQKHVEEEVLSDLQRLIPGLPWEPFNQAFKHLKNGDEPYASTEDALAKWPETATTVGVTMSDGTLRLVAPHGIDDLVGMVVRPTPFFLSSDAKKEKLRVRQASKNWLAKWPKLRMMID